MHACHELTPRSECCFAMHACHELTPRSECCFARQVEESVAGSIIMRVVAKNWKERRVARRIQARVRAERFVEDARAVTRARSGLAPRTSAGAPSASTGSTALL